MEAQDPRDVVKRLVDILRKITETVKALPFIYLIIYVVYIAINTVTWERTIGFMDYLFTISPSVTVCFLCLSRLLKLCAWHKTACVIPLTGQMESYIDSNIVQLTQNEVILINVIIGILVSGFLIMARKHFCNGRERTN